LKAAIFSPIIRQTRGQASYRISLRLGDHMPVQPKRDARIAVPQLRLHNCNRRAAVDEFASYRVAKRVKSGQRYP
jgi:hypothetical protein